MRTRRGSTLLETVTAVAIMAVLIAVAMKGVTAIGTQRQTLAHRETALREAANLAERLGSRPFGELSTEKLASVRVSDEAAAALAGATVKIDVAARTADPSFKRVAIEVSWLDSTGLPQRPARVVFFKHRTDRE